MFQVIKLAWIELVVHKTRSILTSLGIIIGVFSVTLILTSGEIARSYLSGTLLDSIGDTRLVRLDPFLAGGPADQALMLDSDFEYVKSLEGALPFEGVSADFQASFPYTKTDDTRIRQTVQGVSSSYFQTFVSQFDNLGGRVFTPAEEERGDNVAVVSRAFVKNVLLKSSAIDQTFKIGGRTFLIIGEFDTAGTLFDTAEQVYIPLKVLWQIDENPENRLIGINVIAKTEGQINLVATQLGESINSYRKNQFLGRRAEKLNVRIASSALSTVNNILTAFQVFLALIAVVSLLVGGIGVLNVMLMSVSQRIREIGIRKALGARAGDITSIFLAESMMLTTVSGLIGSALAQYFSFIGVDVIKIIDPNLSVSVNYSLDSLYLATILSAILGFGFGIYPAIQASKLSIVDALKFE
jgi:putative ABC transport system permease protein